MTTLGYQVVIIGAGPYGLAAAAHLRSAGVETCVFGKPMVFWQQHMPAGMLLRSSWSASHISDPYSALSLDAYQAACGIHIPTPVPLDHYITYGQWFQRQAAPDLDQRQITRIEVGAAGFRLMVEDGESLSAQRVVVAGGIAPFAYRPDQFDTLPPELVSHTSEHADLGRFAGRRVAVIGGGQSAIESAALLHEHGAAVDVLTRGPQVRWLQQAAWLRNQPESIRRLLYPPTDVGPPGLNQLVARPDLFRRLPRALQQRIAYRSIRPAAARWLVQRMAEVRITTGCSVISAAPAGEQLRIMLSDGTQRHVDHALLATGYRVDVSRYPFLAPELVRSLRRFDGYPQLKAGFESSAAGLHFLGAPAAWSFGPLMRFVSGTEFAARALTRYVVEQPRGRMHSKERSWLALPRPHHKG